jgi:uncharacterized protein YndB with AHSA1/START domain
MTDRSRGIVVENSVEIRRSSEDVFDYCTDLARETEWNPRTRYVEKLTDDPIGLGTRYRGEWIKGDPMTIDFVRFERPTLWASYARSRHLDARSESRVSPTEIGARLTTRTELIPHGFLRILLPFIRRTMHRREDDNLARIKLRLERHG